MSCKIQKIKTVSGLGLTPARVHRPTGTVFLNSEIWKTLTDEAKEFIIAHEKGHFCKQTVSEIEADAYAFNELAGKKQKSLQNIIKSISENLEIKKIPAHKKRYEIIVFRALLFDWLNFKNFKAYKILKQMEATAIQNLFIEYLKNKGITNVNELTDDEKEIYLTDFMLTPEMQDITLAEVQKELAEKESEYSNFKILASMTNIFKNKGENSGNKKPIFSPETKEKFKNAFNNIAGGLISKLGKGFGFNPDVSAISNAVNPANNISAVTPGKTNDENSKPNVATTEEPKPEADKKDKNKKIMIYGGIGFLIIGIIIALYFAFRNN